MKKEILVCLVALASIGSWLQAMEETVKTEKQTLYNAAQNLDYNAVEKLISQGVDVNQPHSEYGDAALHWLAKDRILEESEDDAALKIFKALIDAGANVNQPTKDGVTPLMEASLRCSPQLIQAFLDAGADPTLKLKNGETALDFVKRVQEVLYQIESPDSPIYKRCSAVVTLLEEATK